MKVEQRERYYPEEGQHATDFCEAWHNRFRVFLVGVDQVRGEDEECSYDGNAHRILFIDLLYILDKRWLDI